MRAARFLEVGKVETGEAPVPAVRPETALIEVKACGVCGTDVHIFKGEFPAEFPVIPGHELSGIVREVGPGVTIVKPGDVVVVDPNIVCHLCVHCREGRRHLCANLKNYGIEVDGGFAEYILVREREIVPVADMGGRPFEHFALSEPVGCCLHGIGLAEITAGDTVVILGAGPIGLIMTQLARMRGPARLLVIEPAEMKRELAKSLGADEVYGPEVLPTEEGRGDLFQVADVAFDCAGREATAGMLVPLLRDGGRGMFFGVCAPQDRVTLSPYEIYRRELTLRGSFTKAFTLLDAVALIAAGKVNLAPLISNRYAVEEFPVALSRVGAPDTIKNMVVF